MATQAPTHQPVMAAEALELLRVRPDGRYVDATYGRGGHAALIVERLDGDGRLLVVDCDPAAVADAESRFRGDARVVVRQARFGNLRELLSELDWDGVDGLLLDLGVSSPQLDQPERGFSFQTDGPLDMRMDNRAGPSAAEWLAAASTEEIAQVLRDYGEERRARRIARAIEERRRRVPLSRTGELAALVEQVLGRREQDKHPATRTFQAIRIHLNGELAELERVLELLPELLNPCGRVVVISFHSLEDRCVKRALRALAVPPPASRRLPPTPTPPPPLRLLGKARSADADELARNPRSRSATLRAAERR